MDSYSGVFLLSQLLYAIACDNIGPYVILSFERYNGARDTQTPRFFAAGSHLGSVPMKYLEMLNAAVVRLPVMHAHENMSQPCARILYWFRDLHLYDMPVLHAAPNLG
ncbi:hypothetical protein HD554DRAFT_1563812 [Boletus coccyginus]|nr:hypothetical protein HD554DRAFT_1563812 [Boletus coccyginus]